MLRKANEIRPKIKALVYGRPGSGKTTFAASGHNHSDMGETLILDVEDGSLSISDTDVLLTEKIDTMAALDKHLLALRQRKEGYENIGTVVLDSGTRLSEIALAEIVAKRVNEKGRGSLDTTEIQDFGALTKVMIRRLQMLRDMPLNVIVTALARETSPDATPAKPNPPPTDVRPEFTPRLGELVQATFDHVWLMKRDDSGNHSMLVQRHSIFTAKTRGPRFASELGTKTEKGAVVALNPTLADCYDLLIKTQGAHK